LPLWLTERMIAHVVIVETVACSRGQRCPTRRVGVLDRKAQIFAISGAKSARLASNASVLENRRKGSVP
jgi:hypothetical protein